MKNLQHPIRGHGTPQGITHSRSDMTPPFSQKGTALEMCESVLASGRCATTTNYEIVSIHTRHPIGLYRRRSRRMRVAGVRSGRSELRQIDEGKPRPSQAAG